MDSADAFWSALANQGVILGMHKKALRQLNEQQGLNNQRLTQMFDLLTEVHDHFSASFPGMSTSSSSVPLPPSQDVTPEHLFRDAAFLTPAFTCSPRSFTTDATMNFFSSTPHGIFFFFCLPGGIQKDFWSHSMWVKRCQKTFEPQTGQPVCSWICYWNIPHFGCRDLLAAQCSPGNNLQFP